MGRHKVLQKILNEDFEENTETEENTENKENTDEEIVEVPETKEFVPVWKYDQVYPLTKQGITDFCNREDVIIALSPL